MIKTSHKWWDVDYKIQKVRGCPKCGNKVKKGNKFCNQSCAASFNNVKFRKRKSEQLTANCLNCNVRFEYRSNRQYGMYCGNTCQHEHKANILYEEIEEHGGWPDGKLNKKKKPYSEQQRRKMMKKYLIHKNGDKCEECGWNEVNIHTKKSKELIARCKPPLSACTLEHSDGNPDNNKLDNLKILCPSCHSLTKFYGSRGKGHDERRNRFSKEKKQ